MYSKSLLATLTCMRAVVHKDQSNLDNKSCVISFKQFLEPKLCPSKEQQALLTSVPSPAPEAVSDMLVNNSF